MVLLLGYILYIYIFFFCERAVATLNVLLTYFQSEHTKFCVYLSSAAATVNFDVRYGFVNGYLSITALYHHHIKHYYQSFSIAVVFCLFKFFRKLLIAT